jgi:segregation and condensation protein B
MPDENSQPSQNDPHHPPPMNTPQGGMGFGEAMLEARIEALLFISSGPVGIDQIAEALQVSSRSVKHSIDNLRNSLANRGIRLHEFDSHYQLTTAPEFSTDVERLLTLEETSTLSRAAMEVLAIIAYQQPVTRPQIDSIRGVNSDSVLRTLLRYGLIEEAGRNMSPGRPILYKITSEFLQYFGLAALEDLPPLDLELLSEFINPEQPPKDGSPE